MTAETTREHTCARCGLTDASVLDLDTGSACHPELRHCIAKLRAAYDAIARERDAMFTDALKYANERNAAERERDALRGVVEKARAWMADMWRGDMNGTVIGVCMEYESDGQYVLWEQVAPIVDAVRALDAGGAG